MNTKTAIAIAFVSAMLGALLTLLIVSIFGLPESTAVLMPLASLLVTIGISAAVVLGV